jgi:hypothetical protein
MRGAGALRLGAWDVSRALMCTAGECARHQTTFQSDEVALSLLLNCHHASKRATCDDMDHRHRRSPSRPRCAIGAWGLISAHEAPSRSF